MALSILPLNGQSLNVTRDPIRNNFVTINDDFIINHGEYNTALRGQHRQVMMPAITVLPVTVVPVTQPDQIILYSADGADSGETELWMRREDGVGGFGLDVCMTEYRVVDARYQWTMLPSGVIIQCGYGDTSVPVVYPKPFADLWSCTATPLGWPHYCSYIVYPTNFGFTIRVSRPDGTEVIGTHFYWTAIGLKA